MAAAAAGAVALARKKRGGGERVEIHYEDGAAISLDAPTSPRDSLLAHARAAVRAVRA